MLNVVSQPPESILPPFHFTIQMWGKNYTQPFTEVTLPLMLSPNNLPAIDNLENCVFDLYTTSQDLPDITSSAAFKRLQSLLPVQISLIDDLSELQGHYKMSACNRRAIQKSDQHGRIIVFLQPDTCVSDGTLKNMERVLKSGKRVVQVAGFRTQMEKMIPVLQPRYRKETDSIQFTGRELIELAKDRLHPISQTCLWDSEHFTNYNAHIYWRIGDEGFLARCAYFHPLAIYPRVRKADFDLTIDYNYFDNAVPDFDDYYIVTDSDEMCMCEMSREHYFMGTFQPNTASSFQIAMWMEGHTNTQKPRQSFAKKIYLHSGKTDNPAWAAAERFSDGVLKDALSIANRSLLQLLISRHFLVILRERSRLFYHTGTVFHPSDKPFIRTVSQLIGFYKYLRNQRAFIRPWLGRQKNRCREIFTRNLSKISGFFTHVLSKINGTLAIARRIKDVTQRLMSPVRALIRRLLATKIAAIIRFFLFEPRRASRRTVEKISELLAK